MATLRSGKTEAMYRLIGGKSPILDITKAQAEALEKALNREADSPPISLREDKMGVREGKAVFKVYVGMRYWHPFIEDSVSRMHRNGIRRVIAISLYPHYSLATAGSAMEKFSESIRQYPMEFFCISSWYDHPLYIEALADVITRGLESFSSSRGDVHLLFSAHSLPVSIVESGDPYVSHVKCTIDAVVKRVALEWHLSYQSKSGPVKWLEPTTDDMIRELARRGVRNLLVVPVSFVSDHIETLYEIDILYKQLAASLGMELIRAESLNTHYLFIKALEEMVTKSIKDMGWKE